MTSLPAQMRCTDEPCILLSDAANIAMVQSLLKHRGKVLLHSGGVDPEGRLMQDLVRQIGRVNDHGGDGDAVWHIRYDPAGRARSHTMQPFPFHTDCSFEDPPPRYLALYVVREDGRGGGVTRLLEVRHLLQRLRPATLMMLRSTRYTFRVPVEFYKATDRLRAQILLPDDTIRYRRELIDDTDCTARQRQALDELDWALETSDATQSLFLRTGTLLLLDNGRFLHARSPVLDPRRHLLRMRFHAR